MDIDLLIMHAEEGGAAEWGKCKCVGKKISGGGQQKKRVKTEK